MPRSPLRPSGNYQQYDVASELDENEVTGSEGAFALGNALYLVGERAVARRAEGLQQLTKGLRADYLFDEVESQVSTLGDALAKCVKKGKGAERSLAFEAAQVVALTLGTESEEFARDIEPQARELLRTGKNATALSAAIRTLAVMCFINGDSADTQQLLSDILGWTGQPGLREMALNSYAFLLTSCSLELVADEIIPNELDRFVTLLSDDDLAVKIAAGRCIALMIDVARRHAEEEDEDFDLNGLDTYVDVDDMLELLGGLRERQRGQSKKDQKTQRVAFREIVRCIENDESPSETVVIRHQKVLLGDMSQIVRYEVVRDILGPGMAVHMANNELMHDIFDAEIDAEAKQQFMSRVEKRLVMSPNSPAAKSWTQNRSRQRQAKNKANGFGEL